MLRIALFTLIIIGSSLPARADEFRLKSGDKQTHMLAGYGLSLTGTMLLEKKAHLTRTQSVLLASVFTMLVGTAKELWIDKHYSAGDQWANLIGTAGSATVVFAFKF